MNRAPRGARLHIAVFGRRNAGKSSLLNALTGQQVAIVSPVPGTTTDPVEKAMELLPIGPVLLIDTAGIDDEGELGALRVAATRAVIDRTDIAIVAARADGWGEAEDALVAEFAARRVPAIAALTHADCCPVRRRPQGIPCVVCSAPTRQGYDELRAALIASVPEGWLDPPAIVSDLLPPGGLCVLVVPIDKEAPKGRLILPQVQAIRDLLDGDQIAVVVKERELAGALARLGRAPDLVVTDSQAFLKVCADVPPGVPVTSFSILFARYKGDLDILVAGAAAIDGLRDGDRVLIAESCTHHAISDDIGRVKIPRWLTQYSGRALVFQHHSGHGFPPDLASYRLVIHCGACTTNRREVLSRIWRCREAGVPITNYGVAIAKTQGLLERVLAPFPSALETLRRAADAARTAPDQPPGAARTPR
ncbi:MAG: [FeFe] hydrogenase H-cluster maturation GTPase HydF [Planctomycetota bacterium]|nr:[FeFe] hydrogenase H-cluster maturation GTPase HydF [Planctomycetota bacterium]MCX8040782.1 [FeFe] hydrogenase H-cluster maturation GTPase HydF [Planctomycetota bacterium]MDW8372028.1 [FeFe] hydrogenase H-cluster maturation GTPase HydF [Planctomycetota bacterium]